MISLRIKILLLPEKKPRSIPLAFVIEDLDFQRLHDGSVDPYNFANWRKRDVHGPAPILAKGQLRLDIQ
jgi:hypothetical protein